MASIADGLAKAPRLLPRPSELLLWGLWLAVCSSSAPKALAVAVLSQWVTCGHCARWQQGAMSSCLLPLQGELLGIIQVQHKDRVPSRGVQVLYGLCVPLQWDSGSDSDSACQGSSDLHGPGLSPLCCSPGASHCCWQLLGKLQHSGTGMLHVGLGSHWWDMSCVPIPVAMSLTKAACAQPGSPDPVHYPGSPPKDNGIASSLPAGGREVNFQQTQADASAKDFPSSYQQEFGKGCV